MDPNPPPLQLPDWKPGESRIGKWDMGHIPGHSYKSLRQRYINCKITKAQYLAEYRDEDMYVPEDPSRNRSRKNDTN